MAPKVLGIGTSVPEYQVKQEDVKELVALLFQKGFRDIDRLLGLFEHAKIHTRHLAQPLAWYAQPHSFAETNALYEQIGYSLVEKAAMAAFENAGVRPEEIGGVILVSSTGIATPTLDAKLIQNVGISRHAVRLPIWGLGCGGGVAGMARAMEMIQGTPGRKVLVVAMELCSLTFQYNDLSKSNLVGTGLFADGAAAAILGEEGAGPSLLGGYTTLFDDTEDVMGWDVVDTGLKVRFSRDIPAIVHKYLPDLLTAACTQWGISRQDISYYVAHPGGAKVITAYADSLGLPLERFAAANDVLAAYGNMSSASVLFVLKHFLEHQPPEDRYGVMLSLGPGFSSDQVLFKW